MLVSRFPDRDVGLTSCSGELAHGFSRHARGFYEEGGGSLSRLTLQRSANGVRRRVVASGLPVSAVRSRVGAFISASSPIRSATTWPASGWPQARNGTVYIEDVARGRWSPGRRDGMLQVTAQQDQLAVGRVPIWLEEEAGVAGKDRTLATIRMLAGYSVRAERPTGSKEIRADPLAAQAEAGMVKLVRGDWNTAFLDELASFPHGKHDDQVDAASGAFSKITNRILNVPVIKTLRI